MKPHWRRLLFFLPLAILFGTPAAIMWLGGEFTSPETVIARQADRSRLVLLGRAYSDPSRYVKKQTIARGRPQVLALGNSRVMQFRAELFRPDVTFYNAGGCVLRIQDFRSFLEALPVEALPRTLILGVDHSFFLPQSDRYSDRDPDIVALKQMLVSYSAPGALFQQNWHKVWSDLYAGKIELARLADGRGLGARIGITAACREQGFRNDGSMQYGGVDLNIANPRHRDFGFAGTLDHIHAGRGRFGWSENISERALRELDLLLDFGEQRGMEITFFQPPHAHTVWAAIQESGRYGYLAKLGPILRERCAARKQEYYDFSDMADLQAPDSEAIDGYHGSERTYLRLFIAMLERGSRLKRLADLPALQATLSRSTAIQGLDYRGSPAGGASSP